jgi:hypothetical protein
MNTVYVVEFSAHNKTSGAWAHKVSGSSEDKDEAKALWHSESSRLMGSADFDYVMILMRTSSGNVEYLESKTTPEPEPEPTGE